MKSPSSLNFPQFVGCGMFQGCWRPLHYHHPAPAPGIISKVWARAHWWLHLVKISTQTSRNVHKIRPAWSRDRRKLSMSRDCLATQVTCPGPRVPPTRQLGTCWHSLGTNYLYRRTHAQHSSRQIRKLELWYILPKSWTDVTLSLTWRELDCKLNLIEKRETETSWMTNNERATIHSREYETWLQYFEMLYRNALNWPKWMQWMVQRAAGVLPDIMTDYAQWRQGLIE